MKIDIKKQGKGHDVFIENTFAFWVIGSKRCAKKELQIHLRKQNEDVLKPCEYCGKLSCENECM